MSNERLKDLTAKSSTITLIISISICFICCTTMGILFDHTKGVISAVAVGGIMFNFIIVLMFGVVSFELIINLIMDIFTKKKDL